MVERCGILGSLGQRLYFLPTLNIKILPSALVSRDAPERISSYREVRHGVK